MLVRAVGLTSELVLPGAEARPAARAAADPPRWLVLSADGEIRRAVVDAVRRTGAVCHAVHDVSGPGRVLLVRPYQYAFIDIAHPPDDGRGIDGWVDALRLCRCRLVVHGADGDADGERWARERGAVLYLPGRIDLGGFARIVQGLRVPAAVPDYSCSPSMRASPSGPMSTCRLMGWQQTGQSST
jgi:hypothetical protein